MADLIDLTGQRFGMLVVTGRTPGRSRHWDCVCDCGGSTSSPSPVLRGSRSTSCGCINRTQGGLAHTREYRIWNRMIARCYRPANINYKSYGAVGKYVCRRWRESFQEFYADLGPSPSKEHSLDRIDTNGSYTCGKCQECIDADRQANCRWVTKAVQVRNMKTNLHYTHGGETLILKDWARKIGIKYHTLYFRVKNGMPFAEAISKPVQYQAKRRQEAKAVRGATASSGTIRFP